MSIPTKEQPTTSEKTVPAEGASELPMDIRDTGSPIPTSTGDEPPPPPPTGGG